MTYPDLKEMVRGVDGALDEMEVTLSRLKEDLVGVRVAQAGRHLDAAKAKEQAAKSKLRQAKEDAARKAELEKKRIKSESNRSRALIPLKDAHSKVVGYTRKLGRTRCFYNVRLELVAREENGRTYDRNNVCLFRGELGLYVLGQKR